MFFNRLEWKMALDCRCRGYYFVMKASYSSELLFFLSLFEIPNNVVCDTDTPPFIQYVIYLVLHVAIPQWYVICRVIWWVTFLVLRLVIRVDWQSRYDDHISSPKWMMTWVTMTMIWHLPHPVIVMTRYILDWEYYCSFSYDWVMQMAMMILLRVYGWLCWSYTQSYSKWTI